MIRERKYQARPPRTVNVIGQRYAVREGPSLQVATNDAPVTSYSDPNDANHEHMQVLGLTDADAQVIVLDYNVGDDRRRSVFLHELLHACIAETGLRDAIDSDTEERVIKRLSPVLLEVLRRNPSVYTFLTGKRVR